MIVQPSTVIFLNSKQRVSGTPYDYYINFNNELIKAPKGHYIQFSVLQASINRSWYSIQEGENTFQITTNIGGVQTVTIPVGYYNAIDLRVQLQSTLPTWTFLYDKKINKFTFTAPNDWVGIAWRRFIFSNSSISDLFGFDQTETPTFTQATPTVVSSKPVKVNEDQAILIHTNLPRQKFSALDNTSKNIVESDVLCALPINSAPFDNVVYTRNSLDDFTYNVLAHVVHSMRIYVTNEQNTLLRLPYDWQMTLQVKYIPYEQDSNKFVLENIRDMIRLFMLNQMDFSKNETENNQEEVEG